MTPHEHYKQAEEWLRRAAQAWENEDGDLHNDVVAQAAATIAQGHASLSLHGLDDGDVWDKNLGRD